VYLCEGLGLVLVNGHWKCSSALERQVCHAHFGLRDGAARGLKGAAGGQGVWPGHKLNQTKAKSSVKMWSDDGSTSIEFYIDLSLLRCFWSNDTLKK